MMTETEMRALDRAIATDLFGWTPECEGSGATSMSFSTALPAEPSPVGGQVQCPVCTKWITVDPVPGVRQWPVLVPHHERYIPTYSTDIRLAFRVVDAMVERGCVEVDLKLNAALLDPSDSPGYPRIIRDGPLSWLASFRWSEKLGDHGGHARRDTREEAICWAALRALHKETS